MLKIYATMVGDLFHRGHLEFIKKAKKLGDYLIIGLHPDDIIKKYKRAPIICFEDRKEILQAIKGVNLVVEDCMDYRSPTMFENVEKYKIDIVIHGNDWIPPLYKELKCKVAIVPYYDNISTTKIIENVKHLLKEKRDL